MRLVADLLRGVEVNKALDILQHNPKDASISLENYCVLQLLIGKLKNEDKSLEEEHYL